MSNEDNLTVYVQLALPGDEEQLDRTTRQLRGELKELDVISVDLVAGKSTMEGSKGLALDPAALGALAVAITPLMLTKFLEFLQAWAMRREGRSVKIKIATSEGAAIEVEVPETMDLAGVQAWIKMISQSLPKGGKRKK